MSRLSVAALVAVAAFGCGGRQHTHARGDEYLAAIRIEGNQGIPEDDLMPGLALRRTVEAGRGVDPYVLALDLKRIRGAYVRLGYFAVDVRARVDHAGDAATVVFTVKEGARAKTRVELVGLPTNNPELSVDKLRKIIVLADGAPFDYEAYDDAKQPLLAAIEDAGYAHAQVGATVIADRANNEAIARYIFDPGPPCTFGEPEIVGAPGELEGAVRARLAFKPGDTYSASALAKSQRALYEFGRFSTVRVDAVNDLAATAIVIKVAVSTGTRHEVKFGGGFGYEPLTYDLRGRAGYSVSGCLRELTNCSVDLQPAVTLDHDLGNLQPKLRALARVERLDFLHTFVKGEAELGYDFLTVEAYTNTGPHARLGLSTPLGVPWILLRVGWLAALYEFISIDGVINAPTAAALHIDSAERLGVYQQSLVVDLRDNPLAPKKGLYFETRVGEGTAYAGGAFTYQQVSPELRGYVPLYGFVLAARAHVGEIFGDVPPTERFYSGGAVTQRGFNERSLSPTILGLDSGRHLHAIPIGGAVLVETGVELRTPPTSIFGIDFAAVGFLDGGDVTETQAEMDLGNLHWAAGGGLRIPTPIGAVRIDVGYRLNRLGPGEPEPLGFLRPLAIHFGIGEAY